MSYTARLLVAVLVLTCATGCEHITTRNNPARGRAPTPAAPEREPSTDEDADDTEQRAWIRAHGREWLRETCKLPPDERDAQLKQARERGLFVSCTKKGNET